MKLFGSLLAAVVVGVTALGLHAQESSDPALLEELFSTGTHAYYAGEFRQAYELLSEAIEGGFQDPRVFYMRGVVLHALGRPEQGTKDFRQGAELEVRQQVDPQDVNSFLVRVQGRLRVKLETIRRQERVKVLRRIQAERRARYQAMLQRQREVSVPEKPGVDPLADQSELPAELASKLKRPGAGLAQIKPQPAVPAASPQPKPAGGSVAQNKPAAEAPAASAGENDRPKAKPGTLRATAKVLGKMFGEMFRPPANLPGGDVPLPGIGGPQAPGPQQPANRPGSNPFDF